MKPILIKENSGYTIKFNNSEFDVHIPNTKNEENTKFKVNSYIKYNNIILENANDFDFLSNDYNFSNIEPINEVDIFDVERRDLVNISDFINSYKSVSKNIKPKKKKKYLKDFQQTIKRDDIHKSSVFDNLYQALGIK